VIARHGARQGCNARWHCGAFRGVHAL
jgi:hypothetical protein